MSLMDMLDRAQGGRLFAAVAASLDLDAVQTRAAMAKLCPAIAERLHAKAAGDPDLFQSLLDIIADNGAASPLAEAEGLTGAEAVADGNAILDDVFGSRSAAMAELRAVDPSLPERELTRLAPISATAVVAALAEANRPMAAALMEPQPAAGAASGQGFFGALVAAIIAGIVSALSRQLRTTTRRRSTGTGYARTRRRSTTTASRRRRRTASVEDVFRDILGNIGKR